jgi:uncharacterized protein
VKLVVDTNTLISGSLWAGPESQLLEQIAQGKAQLVTSPQLLAEFADVLLRPKFFHRVAARLTTAEDLARKLAQEATVVAPAELPLPTELRDPKDLPVLACAVAARANGIVSGDHDLLVLRTFQGIPIMTARESLQFIAGTRQ